MLVLCKKYSMMDFVDFFMTEVIWFMDWFLYDRVLRYERVNYSKKIDQALFCQVKQNKLQQ